MNPNYAPPGGLPPQTTLMTQRAVFTPSYCVIPKGCFSDIVTSFLPGWDKTRLWLIARPMSGFAETFSQYVMEVAPGGGSDAPDPETVAEHWLFFTAGLATLIIDGAGHEMEAGSCAYIPPRHPLDPPCRGQRPRPLPLAEKTLRERTWSRRPRSLRHQRSRRPDPLDAGHRRPLGHHPLRRTR